MVRSVLYLVLQQLPKQSASLLCSAELVSVLTAGAAKRGVVINIKVPAQLTLLPLRNGLIYCLMGI